MHHCKEIENFLLLPDAIDRAAARKVEDRCRRTGINLRYVPTAATVLERFAASKKAYILSQMLARRKDFIKTLTPKLDDATINEHGLEEFEKHWARSAERIDMLPGKDALSAINETLQEAFGVSVTPTAIIDAMEENEIPEEMKMLLQEIADFTAGKAKELETV